MSPSNVNCWRPLPSAFISQMFPRSVSLPDQQAIFLPSGDQLGAFASGPAGLSGKVSCLGPDPSAFITQIWDWPLCVDEYTILSPSDEKLGVSLHLILLPLRVMAVVVVVVRRC